MKNNNFFKDLIENHSISEQEIRKLLKLNEEDELYYLIIFYALPVFFHNGQVRGIKNLLDLWIQEKSKMLERKWKT